MNSLESAIVLSPFNTEDECAMFAIDDNTDIFKLPGTMLTGNDYTFSCWIQSEEAGSIVVGEVSDDSEWLNLTEFETTAEWVYLTYSFESSTTDLSILFQTTGTYYIYHPQLEKGNRATDWTPAPEDTYDRFDSTDEIIEDNANELNDVKSRTASVEASLAVLADSVVTLVTDEEGNTTRLEQTGSGWIFSLTDLDDTINGALTDIADLLENRDDVSEAIESLKSTLDDHSRLQDYVHIGSLNGQPCIELGEKGCNFKLRITNTEMYFMNGEVVLTTVTNQKMIVEHLHIKRELQIGGNDYTNQVPISTDSDGTVFNGIGYIEGYCLEGGELVESADRSVTGYIPFDLTQSLTLYTRGFGWSELDASSEAIISFYDASYEYVYETSITQLQASFGSKYWTADGDLDGATYYAPAVGVRYIRLCGAADGSNYIVAINTRPQGSWVWQQRTNGNLGLLWKGAGS